MQHIYLSCRCKICIEHSRTVEAALSFSFKKRKIQALNELHSLIFSRAERVDKVLKINFTKLLKRSKLTYPPHHTEALISYILCYIFPTDKMSASMKLCKMTVRMRTSVSSSLGRRALRKKGRGQLKKEFLKSLITFSLQINTWLYV